MLRYKHMFTLFNSKINWTGISLITGISSTNLQAHCVESVRIRSYFDPHFPAFGLTTERYGVSLRSQSECGKMRIRITANTDIFHAVTLTT